MRRLPTAQRLVREAIIRLCDGGDMAEATYRQIAHAADVNKDTVIDAVHAWVAEGGLLVRHHRRQPSVFVLNRSGNPDTNPDKSFVRKSGHNDGSSVVLSGNPDTTLGVCTSFFLTKEKSQQAARASAHARTMLSDAESKPREQDPDRNRWVQRLIDVGHIADRAHAFVTEARKRKDATPRIIGLAVAKLAAREADGINDLVKYGLRILAGEIALAVERKRNETPDVADLPDQWATAIGNTDW